MNVSEINAVLHENEIQELILSLPDCLYRTNLLTSFQETRRKLHENITLYVIHCINEQGSKIDVKNLLYIIN